MSDQLPSGENILWHQSGVSSKGHPFVQLIRGDAVICQMSVAQARDHAHAILEAAEASEQDAFLWDYARNVIKTDEAGAAKLIREFRDYRANRTGKKGGPANPRDWVMPPGQAGA